MGSGALNGTSALSNTLDPIFSGGSGLAYAAYNDEPPSGGTKTSGAHAKGVMAFDGTSGFWLIHSVPLFPEFSASSYAYPDSGTIYGQTFLCMSLTPNGLNTAAGQMRLDHVDVYASNLPSSMAAALPNLASLLNGDFQVGTHVAQLTVSSGQVFTSFAKDPSWAQDLGEYLVSPQLKTGMVWETWRRGSPLPVYCTPSAEWDSYDALTISIGGYTYEYTKDHSKFGVSTDSSKPWVCVGDINRMESQRKRGGGTACVKLPNLYAALSSIIATSNACK